ELFQLGFLPFSLGLGLLFWFVALALELRERPTATRTAGLAQLGAVLALAHVACAFVAVATVGALFFAFGLAERRAGKSASVLHRAAFAALVLAPATIVGAWEALGSGYRTLPPPPWEWDFATALKFTASLQALVCHRDIEKGLALGVVALFAVALVSALA